MKIAIIEDDANIRSLIKLVLSDLEVSIDEFANGWQALDAVLAGEYGLCILDIMLPGVNGLEICRRIRQSNKNIPILMLTSKSEEDDKINGLTIGADDYLTKPFSNRELLARAKALIRRSENQTSLKNKANQIIRIGNLILNIESRTLHKKDKEINLTSKEFELMQLFMTNPGRNFTRNEVLERIWGEHFDGLEHTVNSNINRLRSKIEDDPSNPIYLLTIWGIGYKFSTTVTLSP
jgi:DNA-binding response OmpR family regulator